MKNKLNLFLAMCMVLAVLTSAALAADEGVMPIGEPHCPAGTLHTTQISYKPTGEVEVQNCTHGAIGAEDKRFEYETKYRSYCTGCDYDSIWSTTTWTAWQCQA